MASWAALNVAEGDARASLAQERATEEAQDADNAALYEQALRFQQRRQTEQAEAIYQQLLSGQARLSPRLEYLCLKNQAAMAAEARNFDRALGFFASALELDATDVVVWYQMATTALETGKLWLARRTLEEGFKVDATYWPLVETLAEVLNQIGDVDEYKRMAEYIRHHDGQCATVRVIDDEKIKNPTKREMKLLKNAKRKLQHLKELDEVAVLRREIQLQEMKTQLETKMQSRKYELQQPSWSSLGKLLLEAFEEKNRDERFDVLRTKVEIHVGYDQEEKADVEMETEDAEDEKNKRKAVETEKQLPQDESDHPPPAKRLKHKASTALETSLSTGISDNDTQDSGTLAQELAEFMPRRRKSRRHEERLREEHAAAVKEAREKNLAYRLGAFLPDFIGKEDRESTPESVSIEWLRPLNIELVDTEFCISDADKKTLSRTPVFACAASDGGAGRITDSQSSQTSLRECTAPRAASLVGCVTGRQISMFVSESNAEMSPSRGILNWVRHFLNQCGKWSHLKLGNDDEGIHRVCMWLEKALKGELDFAKATTPTRSSLVHVADHSLIQSSRFEGNGLTLGAQVFLLELHFDTLSQQPVRGKRKRKMRRLVEVQLAQAQKLLFEFGWLEDSEEAAVCPTGDEFIRLLWLIARMYERCGNPQMAQHYYIKSREKLIEFAEGDDSITFRVDLPNQEADNAITLEILDEKISCLRFSDVCSEARRLFDAGDYDEVVSILLGHFFPPNQAPRMADFLNEFETEEEDSSAGDNNNKLFEMVLESLGQSSNFSDEDTVSFLLTIFYYVVEFLDGLNVKKVPSADDSQDEACTNALAAMDFLLTQLTQNECERLTNRDQWLLLCGLCVRCLKPSILLRFDSPNDMLTRIRVVLEVEKLSKDDETIQDIQRMVGVNVMGQLLYVVRSLPSEEFRNLFTLVPHPIKRKQPRRDRIRMVLVEILRFLNRSFSSDDKLAVAFPLTKRSALMTLCCTLMKEEEESLARSEAKTTKQLFGNGAILFVLLYESFARADLVVLPTQLVDLVHLLHERLGQHGICGLTYFTEGSSSGDSRSSSCFLETCTVLLSKFVKQKASVRDEGKSPSKSGEENEEESEYRFQKEVCQCYRCLYDVQILPGCEDHKAGTTFASLQNTETTVKHEDALRLARFAVPILLATKPKNNGQKKERLKLLYAVRDALSDSSFASLSVQPATGSSSLEAFLAPRGLLLEEVDPPFPLDITSQASMSEDEACLGHLWYLMGANFILGRVKRRGNLGELAEMEQHVRERVDFLMKDVLYYHPDRIDSWLRLGKTMKELYHAATDAFAAVLGRKRRIRAFQWYTSKVLAKDVSASNAQGQNASDVHSFQSVVSAWGLFKTMKKSQDAEGHKAGSKPSSSKDSKEEAKLDPAHKLVPPQDQVPIEEYATTYIVQVIEFARRCFEMAARLAEQAATKHELKVRGKSEGEEEFDEELDELMNKIIECNEECGLLLYNVLQEFSLMKELNVALFPVEVYSRLIDKTLTYFRRGLEICEHNEDAHEDHFRLQYMIGKTLKKRRWCELRQQEKSDLEALSTATTMAECFSKAEAAREDGDREHALVHAFYSLQALRIDLTISESPSVSALRLVCNYFYEEDEDGDEDDDSATSEETVVKNTQEKFAEATDTATNADPKLQTSASAARKEEILARLSTAEKDESIREFNVTLARGWLALNIIEALESIPDEDRYFHPSRYVLARIVYWLSTFYSALEQSGIQDNHISILLEAVRARRSEEKMEGPSDAAARALKEMTPIFDKRRPQVVAIWFTEYIPAAKKFEELNQRQMKYDYYRLKYWKFYVSLLKENAAYARLKEVGSWVLACKEEHDVIDIMLGIVLEARGKVLRRRLQEFLDKSERAVITGSNVNVPNMMSPGEDRPVDALLKQLTKTYVYYLEVLNAQQRLAPVMNNCGLLLENAELPMVAVFFSGATKYPKEIPLLEKDTMILDRDFNANVTVIMNALRRDELPPRIYNAQGQEAWKAYLDAARSFCEEKWPERSGKGKSTRKHPRPKTSTPAPVPASQTTSIQATTMGSS
ncbi:Calcineurin-binding protein cabin-1 [Phytophthora citrophthora]|uniref:Calcineurin-binding protein cabin-1 n=1 Tax=Phytophthora citrophthora TaxID=4793 RepID=A0AAD9GMB5_9STRA|nr:Calcineurin-binding protein cabin-1 [Phytophthora citrophthora]